MYLLFFYVCIHCFSSHAELDRITSDAAACIGCWLLALRGEVVAPFQLPPPTMQAVLLLQHAASGAPTLLWMAEPDTEAWLGLSYYNGAQAITRQEHPYSFCLPPK
jgi:hypothetical protein